MAGSTFLIAVCLLIPVFLAGRSYQSVRDRRKFTLALDEALSLACSPVLGVRKGLEMNTLRSLSTTDQKHYEVLRLCECGNWSRALTMIQNIGVSQRSRGLHELYLRLLLKCGHFETLSSTIDLLERKDCAPRLVFGALIACGRWVDAVSFYDTELQSKQGSRKEAALLEHWSSQFMGTTESVTGSSIAKASDVLGKHSAAVSSHSSFDSRPRVAPGVIDKGFELGIRSLPEMQSWVSFEKKYTLCESQTQRVHLIDSSRVRGDWAGLALGLLRAGTSDHGDAPNRFRSLAVLAAPHLGRDRVYRCEHCEVRYRSFSVICPSCFTVSLGEPVQGTEPECDAKIFSACGLDLTGLETLYWEMILPLS